MSPVVVLRKYGVVCPWCGWKAVVVAVSRRALLLGRAPGRVCPGCGVEDELLAMTLGRVEEAPGGALRKALER